MLAELQRGENHSKWFLSFMCLHVTVLLCCVVHIQKLRKVLSYRKKLSLKLCVFCMPLIAQ